MPEISMKSLLEAGVHFGHQTHRWNPKMKPYIFGSRNGIHIIDLEKTVLHAIKACEFVKNTVASGGKVLFVSTKKQAKDAIKEAATRVGMPYVCERWLGGMLTNFQTVRLGCERLDEMDKWKEDGTYLAFTKKEIVQIERKRKKLERGLGGIRSMKALPSAVFVIDPETEKNAVREAFKLGIPIVAVVDTNGNPDNIDYIIPGNDDALKSVAVFINLIAEACLEGSTIFEEKMRKVGVSDKPKEEEKKPLGPVVERIKRRQLRNIPAEFDYREDEEESEENKEETSQ